MKLRNLVLAFGFVLAAFVVRPDAAQADYYAYAAPPTYYCPPYEYSYYQPPTYGYVGSYNRPYGTQYYGSYTYPADTYYYPRPRHYRRAYRKHYRRAYRRHYRRW